MFSNKPKTSAPAPTASQMVEKHRLAAEALLEKSAKAGRLEAETRYAAMAGAHATLALVYQEYERRGD